MCDLFATLCTENDHWRAVQSSPLPIPGSCLTSTYIYISKANANFYSIHRQCIPLFRFVLSTTSVLLLLLLRFFSLFAVPASLWRFTLFWYDDIHPGTAQALSHFSVHRKVFATTKAWRYDDDERPVYKSPELLARNGGHFHLCPLKTANTLASWTDWACKLSDCSGKIGWFDNTPTVWVSFVSTSPWIFISASYYRWSSSSLVRCNFPVFTWTMWKLVWLSSGSGNEVRGGWPQMGGL